MLWQGNFVVVSIVVLAADIVDVAMGYVDAPSDYYIVNDEVVVVVVIAAPEDVAVGVAAS